VNHWEGTVECQGCGRVIGEHLIDESEEVSWVHDVDNPMKLSRRAGDELRDDRREDGGLALTVTGNTSTEVGSEIREATHIMRMRTEDELELKARQLIVQWTELLNLQKHILLKAEDIMFRVDSHKKVFEGHNLGAVAAAALYFAAKVNFVDLLPTEYEKVTGVPFKEIKRAAKTLKGYIEEMLPVDPIKYCKYLCERLRLSEDVATTAQTITENIQSKKLLEGRNPKIIVSTAIFYAVQHSNEKKCGLGDIAKQAKLEENMIKNSFKDIYFYCKDIIPEWKGSLPFEQQQHLQG